MGRLLTLLGRRGRPTPSTIFGSSLKAWLKADAGVFTDAAADLERGSTQYFAKTSPTFSPTTAFTFRCTITPEGMGAYSPLVSRWTNDSSQNQLIVYVNSADHVEVFIASSVADGGNNYATGAATLLTATEYDIVVVYDGTAAAANRIAVYIDGVADSMTVTGTIPTALTTSTAPLRIGSDNALADTYFDGIVSHVGVATSALSGAALTAAHTAAAAWARRSIDYFSYFPLCESTGTREDFGSLGTNGLTAVNAPGVAAGHVEIDVAEAGVGNCPVKRWEDESGNAVHYSTTTVADQPLYILAGQNGRRVVRGDGLTDGLVSGNVTQAQPFTWALVCKTHNTAPTGNDVIIDASAAGHPGLFIAGTDNEYGMYAGTVALTGVAIDTAWKTHVATFSGAASTYHLDGVAATLSANPGTDGYAGVATSLFSTPAYGSECELDIGEVCLIDGTPTAAKRLALEAYFRTRWATP